MKKEDFVNESIVEFQIDGEVYKYKPTTAANEASWVDYYMEMVEMEIDGQMVQSLRQNFEKLTRCKIMNLVEIPCNQELIKEITGIDKPWEKMDRDERWMLLGKLKPKVFTVIVQNINKIDSSNPEVKKN